MKLFFEFFKFGCFTFGGGWSIIAQMQKLYVEERHAITNEELLDITSVGRSMPGTMIGNVAFLFGYHMAGILGGIACVIGMILPPMIVLSIVTYFYAVLQDNVWVVSAMTGVRAAVVPIVVSAASRMIKGAFHYVPCYAIFVLSIVLNLFLDISCVWIVVIGAVGGILISEIMERMGMTKHDSD